MEACSFGTSQAGNEFTDERSQLKSPRRPVKRYDEPTAVSEIRSPRDSNANLYNAVEPVICIYLLAEALSESVITNLLENRACLVDLNLPPRNCSEPISIKTENAVQPPTADVIMVRTIVGALLPSVLTLFVGPWSDTNGRKPFLVIALIGKTLSYLTWGCLSLRRRIHPYMFLLASLPVSFSGGDSIMFLLATCIITDITNDESRPIRLSLLTFTIIISYYVGTAFAPMVVTVQDSLNPYPLVFFLSTALLALTVVYTIFFISETVNVQPDRNRRLFRLGHITGVCKACFSPRSERRRCMILTIIFCLVLNMLISAGESGILYLSAREKFSWTLTDYTFYLCVNCIYAPGTVLGVWLFSSVLGLTNVQAAALSLATGIAQSPIMALATAGWHFYLANIVSFLSGAFDPLVRSELGRLAPEKEHGKIFALTAFLESITPVAAAPLYTAVYTASFLYSPVFVYWLSAGISVIMLLMLISVAVTQQFVSGTCEVVNL